MKGKEIKDILLKIKGYKDNIKNEKAKNILNHIININLLLIENLIDFITTYLMLK